MTRAGSNVPSHLPTTALVETGPYRFTRNPVYLGMVLRLIGLAIAINSLWLLMTLVSFALVIRCGVINREEAIASASSGTSIAATARGYGAGCRACRPRYGSGEPVPMPFPLRGNGIGVGRQKAYNNGASRNMINVTWRWP
jgi:phospholipid methyltransferase